MSKLLLVCLFLLLLQIASAEPEITIVHPEMREQPTSLWIDPNEHRNRLIFPYIANQRGALISVGTFRTFDESAHGNFDLVVMLDYNHGASVFNKLLLNLFRLSKNRYDFLQLLFHGEISSAIPLKSEETNFEIKRLFDRKGKDKVSKEERAFWERIFEPMPSSENVLKKWQKLKTNLSPEEYNILTAIDPARLNKSILNRLRWYRMNDSWDSTLFGSDEVWAKIKEKVQNDQFLIVTGSLAGPETWRSIEKNLNARQTRVGLLDASNVLSRELLGESSVNEIKLVEKTRELMRSLPCRDDALVSLTLDSVHFGKKNTYDDMWVYSLMTAREFIDGVDILKFPESSPKEQNAGLFLSPKLESLIDTPNSKVACSRILRRIKTFIRGK